MEDIFEIFNIKKNEDGEEGKEFKVSRVRNSFGWAPLTTYPRNHPESIEKFKKWKTNNCHIAAR